ncbi:MAG: ATP-binding cassette domain-containing protein, partial [Gammaproteobacteria bacterium]|nr:ATP-binding cassette domain-containing protein [Gammaproteobacteria bacterium]
AVDGVSFDIHEGSCFGLLGPNGAGKTTTLRMIMGQSPITAGTLTVFGLPIPGAVREIRRRTGVVPQQDNADPDFTVAENLRMYARYFDLTGPVVAERIRELLEFVELTDRADSPLRELSGGMKRRLSIARALINDPELIVLDEPTTGLDPQVRRMIWTRLRQLKRSGKTLLLTTHYMDEAERLCDDLVVIDHGQIISHGQPVELITQHVEPHVVEIQGDRPAIDALMADCPGLRLETVGEMHYAYSHDLPSVLARLEKAPQLTYMHRPANLEDVFLRLTGHDLRE